MHTFGVTWQGHAFRHLTFLGPPAMHWLPWVLPSTPQTGSYSRVQRSWRGGEGGGGRWQGQRPRHSTLCVFEERGPVGQKDFSNGRCEEDGVNYGGTLQNSSNNNNQKNENSGKARTRRFFLKKNSYTKAASLAVTSSTTATTAEATTTTTVF